MLSFLRILTVIFLLPIFEVKAQWIEHRGPESGQLRSVAFLGDRFFGVRYVTPGINPVFTSHDGIQWKQVHVPLDSLWTGFAFDVTVEDGKIFFYSAYGPIVVFSADTGRTWQSNQPVVNFPDVTQLLISGNTLLRHSPDAVYRSTDFGKNWQSVAPSSWPSSPRSLAKAGNNHFFATPTAFLKSTDDGQTWLPETMPYPNNLNTVVNLLNTQAGLFLEYQLGVEHAILRSLDFGKTWDTLPTANWTVLRLHEAAGQIFTDINGRLAKSSDGGETWTFLGEIPGKIRGFAEGNGITLVNSDYGPYRLKPSEKLDAGALGLGASGSTIWPHLRSNGQKLLFGDYDFAHISSDNGENWEFLKTSATLNAPPVYSGTHIFLTSNPNFFHSADDGQTWDTLPGDFNGFAPDKMVQTGNYLFAKVGLYLSRSSDWGKTWTDVGLPPGFTGLYSIAANAGRLLIHNNVAVWSTKDGGQTWSATTGLGNNPHLGFLLTTDPDAFYIENNSLIHKLNGNNWEPAHNGLTNPNGSLAIYCEQLAGLGDTVVMLGIDPITAEPSMFATENGGDLWVDISGATPPHLPNFGKSIAYHRGRIYLAGQRDDGSGSHEPVLFSRPLADFTFKQATGQVFEDLNANGLLEPGEPGLTQILVKTMQTGYFATTDSTGKFALFVNAQTQDSLTAIAPGKYSNVTTAPQSLADAAPTGLLQGIHFQENKTDLGVSANVVQPFRPGFGNTVFVQVKNWGTEKTDASLWLALPPQFKVTSAMPPASHVSGDTVFWEILGMQRFENQQFEISGVLDATTILGEKLTLAAQVAASPGTDADGSNNFFEQKETVVGSYDPNDKAVEPEFLTPEIVQDGGRLTYTVRFQNTGSYPATFVKILDTLDLLALDIASLQILGASHAMTWSLRRQNVLEFFFDNINLPDSLHDEAGSHGFVRFSILPKKTLKLGDLAQNRAFIYFDFNLPVETNTVKTAVQLADLTLAPVSAAFDFEVSPNPGRGILKIVFSGELSRRAEVSVVEIAGREIWRGQDLNLARPLFLPELRRGQYVVSVRSGGAVVSKKIVVVD